MTIFKEMKIIRSISFSVIVATATFGVGCSRQDQGMNHDQTANSIPHAANPSDSPYDLQFLDTMIMHHQAAIAMARAVVGREFHPEMKDLVKNIIADQLRETDQMTKWREEWFKGAPRAANLSMPGMTDSMMGMDMQKLGAPTGNDLDLEFINQMLPHHKGAVIMATEALEKSQKDDIKTLANGIIKAQNAEIKQMQDWQKVWQK